MPEPIFATVERVEPPRPAVPPRAGRPTVRPGLARELAGGEGFSLLCGRYEGVDARVLDHLVDGELSIGDYVLAGGEVAAMVVMEAVARLVPGVMGNEESAGEESFADGLLEYPQFTRPAEFRGWAVPEVLRSGDHQRVARWRRARALARTLRRRPDLIEARGGLTDDEVRLQEFPCWSRRRPAAVTVVRRLASPAVAALPPAPRLAQDHAMNRTDLVDQRQPPRRRPRLRARATR